MKFLRPMFPILMILGALLIGEPALAATTGSFDSTDFNGEGWVDGLVDLRPGDINNTSLVSGGLSNSGLEIKIPEGGFRGLGAFDRLPANAEEAWYRYHIQLSNFDAKSSGKLPGLSGLYSETARGCLPSRPGSPGWSARGLFGAAGTNGAPDGDIPIGTYLYHLDQPGRCGEAMYWDNSSLHPGRWHCIEGYVKLNTLGESDGVVTGWLDGTERFSRSGLSFRRPDEPGVGIREMWLDVYYGGKKPTGNALYLTIDEVAVSTSGRVGCLDRSTNVVGSFGGTNDAIASYDPESGNWLMNRPVGSSFQSEQLTTYRTGEDWTTHIVGNFSGKGADDIASFHPSNGTWWVSRSGELGLVTSRWASFSTGTGWGTHLVGDFSGTGTDQIASYNVANGTWWVSEPTVGEGQLQRIDRLRWPTSISQTDPVNTRPSSQIADEVAKVLTPSPDSFTTVLWDSFTTTRGWSDQLTGDFNGDGRDDIASYHPGSGSRWVSVSDGESFQSTQWERFSTTTGWTNQVAGDFNADGLSDVASYHGATGTWWVSISDGDRFVTTLWDAFGTGRGWSTQVAGDFNGDGIDDIASYHPSAGTWWVSLSDGMRFDTTLWADFATTTGWTSQLAGDFDGDGLTDIANYHKASSTWWVSRSTGGSFETTQWSG